MRHAELLTNASRLLSRIPRPVVRAVLGIATVAVVLFAAHDMRSSIPSLDQIRHPNPVWLLIGVLSEFGALVAYALIVQAVLAVWNVSGRTTALLRATLGGIAMGASLPAGQAVSLTYWYRQLRREGAQPRLAAFALAAAGAAGVVSLVVLLVLGVAVAGDAGPLAGARIPILAAGGALIALRVALRRRLGRLARKVLSRFSLEVPEESTFGRSRLAAIGVYAYLNWLLDLGSLVASLAAMHASVPLQSVLLVYALSEIVANLPLLPGGGGTVEISLILGFAAFGQTSGKVVGGVLLFRLISCWGLVPIGWLAVALDRPGLRSLRRRQRGQLPQAVQLDRPHPLARHAQLGRDRVRGTRDAVAKAVP
jgi:putative heme transporter